MQHQKKLDISIIIVTTFLIIFGLLMVYSASNVVALYKYNDSLYIFKRQAIFALIGITLMFAIININGGDKDNAIPNKCIIELCVADVDLFTKNAE